MKLTIIVAVSDNNVIGVNGKIPWNIPEDMKRFKELTLNHSVIMGRKTYESIPEKFRPLPERKNIVLSTSFHPQDGICVARNLYDAINLTDNFDSYVIGGESVYQLFLPIADKLELTRIHREYKGDAFFPDVNWEKWNLTKEISEISRTGIPYSFLTYERRSLM